MVKELGPSEDQILACRGDLAEGPRPDDRVELRKPTFLRGPRRGTVARNVAVPEDQMTQIALEWTDVPRDLPVVIVVGNAERELRKKLLRAGADEGLKLDHRAFQVGTAHPTQLHASVVSGPAGDFVVFDAGRFWRTEMHPEHYRAQMSTLVDVCRHASAVVFDRVDRASETRSLASMAAAFDVPKAAVWIDHLPLEPTAEERQELAEQIARESFRKVQVFEGDLRDGTASDGYRAMAEWVSNPRPLTSEPFRLSVREATSWGVTPHMRIARGVMRGSVEIGDEIEVIGAGERFPTTVEDIARGGIVFRLRDLPVGQIDALAAPGSVEVRDLVAASDYGHTPEDSGEAMIDGVSFGQVSVKTVGRKNVLRFAHRIPFRRGDVVSVVTPGEPAEPVRASHHRILDD